MFIMLITLRSSRRVFHLSCSYKTVPKVHQSRLISITSSSKLQQQPLFNHTPLKPRLTSPHINPAFSSRFYTTEGGVFNRFFYSIYNSPPVEAGEWALSQFHNFTGTPWYLTIIFFTFTLRFTLNYPLSIYGSRVLSKCELLMPDMKRGVEKLQVHLKSALLSRELSEAEAKDIYMKRVRELRQQLWAQNRCHPFQASLVAWLQIPVWVSLSLACRKMTGSLPPEISISPPPLGMESEGIPIWCADLTLPDPYYVLPILLFISHLLTVELHWILSDPSISQSRLKRITRYILRGFSLWVGLISCIMPSGVTLYWTASGVCGLLQTVLIRLPGVRRLVGIPRTPSESQTPIIDALSRLRGDREIVEEGVKKLLGKRRDKL